MAAYVISDVEIRDRALFEKYRSLAQATITKFGGRYIARGDAIENVEGEWTPEGIVIVEFPTMERAREWYSSPDYSEALEISQDALSRRLIFVGGVPST